MPTAIIAIAPARIAHLVNGYKFARKNCAVLPGPPRFGPISIGNDFLSRTGHADLPERQCPETR